MSAGEIRLQTNRFSQASRRLRQFALLLQYRAQRVVGLGVIGFGLDGGAQSFSRQVEIALLPKRDPSV